MATFACPNCGGHRVNSFYHIANVPVNSCLLFTERDAARRLPKGQIDLAFCPDCTFIFNSSWQPDRTTYSADYEETQGFSPTFQVFQRHQAQGLIDRYGLYGKDVVEIGCGKGEFLTLLCELGRNRGVGYDPSFIPERRGATAASITFKQEYFTDKTEQAPPDLICCRMTLEHIPATRSFLRAVRRISSPERKTVVVFQVPDVRRILEEGGFWDIYYEHCSYFSPGALTHLFEHAGFEILRLSCGYQNQYLTIEARATDRAERAFRGLQNPDDMALKVATFAGHAGRLINRWTLAVSVPGQSGGRVVLWGSGSKAVAFLSAIGNAARHVSNLVDINPHRWGKHVPGTGIKIVGPSFLTEFQPHLVIAMNPIYCQEIADDLRRSGCRQAQLLALGDTKSDSMGACLANLRRVVA